MTQYQHDPDTESAAVKPIDRPDRDLRSMQDQILTQQREIADLRRQMRRLQNELRLAVNTFNLKNHG